jgi:hypothetical protein
VNVVVRYLELGLRLGRHVDGLVDSYFGPPEIAERVAQEELRSAEDLRADAEQLREDVAASELEPQRRAWLDDQLRGAETYAGVLGGETLTYRDEVERCFGVRPERVAEETFARAHDRLDAALPGDGPLVDRLEAWRRQTTVPVDALEAAFVSVAALLRRATVRRFGLPDGETFEVELVDDEPWAAYNYYLGGKRSRIAVNTDQPIWASSLVNLVAHEAYPGHHTEHVKKEHALVDHGVLEESLILIPTPQSVVSEGIAENAWDVVADDETTAAVVDALAALSVDFDVEQAEAIAHASRDLRFVGANAALMLHEDGASREEVQAYVQQWSPTTAARAASSVRFVADPLWRSYVATYSSGGALVRKHVDGDPIRFGELLSRQTRVADVLPISSAQ